jgi:hypothetical protein
VRNSALILLFVVAGCEQRTADVSYSHLSDRLKAATGGVFGHPCEHTETQDGIEVFISTPIEDCYKFGPPIMLKGVWLREFEGSKFVKDAVHAPLSWQYTGHDTDLQPSSAAQKNLAWVGNIPERHAYRVTFVGREMLGGFRSRTGTSHVTIIDRMVSIEDIPAPSKTELCDEKRCGPQR